MEKTMKQKILMVDDEKNILEAYARNLRDLFDVVQTESGEKALDAFKENTFTVIVTDYKMPVMNGVELLEKVHEVSPDTVQIMLTGQADMQALVELINKGKIFRFLSKPCLQEDLIKNIYDAIRQYELITAERELLGKTLGGSIKVLTDLLALSKPQAFYRAQRIHSLARKINKEIKPGNAWQIEIAAMLSQIGCVTIPDDILKKAYGSKKLLDYEIVMFQNHPVVASEMIKSIPRLEAVAEIIKYQEKGFNGEGFPDDDIRDMLIPLGARILKISLDYDKAINNGIAPAMVYEELIKKKELYDEELLEKSKPAFIEMFKKSKSFTSKELPIEQLKEGMYFAKDVVTANGTVLGTKDQKITLPILSTIKNYEKNKQIKGIISVIVLLE